MTTRQKRISWDTLQALRNAEPNENMIGIFFNLPLIICKINSPAGNNALQDCFLALLLYWGAFQVAASNLVAFGRFTNLLNGSGGENLTEEFSEAVKTK